MTWQYGIFGRPQTLKEKTEVLKNLGDGTIDFQTKLNYSYLLDRGRYDCYVVSGKANVHMARQQFRGGIDGLSSKVAKARILSDANISASMFPFMDLIN